MRFGLYSYIVAVVCTIVGQAAEIPEHALFRELQDSEDTCARICEDTGSIDALFSSEHVQVVKVEAETKRFDGIFGRLMNGFFNLFQRRQSDKPKYEISTDLLLPSLMNFSIKAKSLGALIRSESATHAAASDTPDVIATIFDLSAGNMESVASVIDSIVDEMSPYESMDLQSMICVTSPLLTFIRDNTFTNIVSITEFLLAKSGNEEMESMYDNYLTLKIDLPDTWIKDAYNPNQCHVQGYGTAMIESETPIRDSLQNVGLYVVKVGGSLLLIVVLLLLYPLSFLASILGIIMFIYGYIFVVVIGFKPLLNGSAIERLLLNIAIAGLPIWMAFLIFDEISLFLTTLLTPLMNPPTSQLFTNQNPDAIWRDVRQASEVKARLLDVLKSPMETIMQVFKNRNDYGGMDLDDEDQMECEMAELKCKSDALIDALPF